MNRMTHFHAAVLCAQASIGAAIFFPGCTPGASKTPLDPALDNSHFVILTDVLLESVILENEPFPSTYLNFPAVDRSN